MFDHTQDTVQCMMYCCAVTFGTAGIL